MRYTGTERRIHRVFVTRNTEYHMRRHECVGVRDRHSGQWLKAHLAVHGQLSGGIRFNLGGGVMPNPGEPRVGESLLLEAAGRDLVTSTVVAIKRPAREVVHHYPARP